MENEEKKTWKVTIEEVEESPITDNPITREIYSQCFDYLNVKEVVKRLNGGF